MEKGNEIVLTVENVNNVLTVKIANHAGTPAIKGFYRATIPVIMA